MGGHGSINNRIHRRTQIIRGKFIGMVYREKQAIQLVRPSL
jgi:hypothetical protein